MRQYSVARCFPGIRCDLLEKAMAERKPLQTRPQRGPQHEALEVFLGEWKAAGKSFGGPNQHARNPRANPTQWTSTHEARWHSDAFFLVQDERAQVGGPFDTLSILGWDDGEGRYSRTPSRITASTVTTR
jgi:hypothetical protein